MSFADLPVFDFLLQNGKRAYGYFGAHCEDNQVVFRVWASNAHKICLIGDFNGWQDGTELCQTNFGGVWEGRVSTEIASVGDRYKFRITDENGTYDQSDPYAFFAEGTHQNASIITDLSSYRWRDEGWIAFRNRNAEHFYSQPMNLYEVHLDSWRRHEDGHDYNYKELASDLAPYVKQMGYTHIALLPVAEHSDEDSWGYETVSPFAPSAKHGTPIEFMSFVDSMHEAGIGVLMDWCPWGASLQEHSSDMAWALASNAFFWIEQYHMDGLRVAGFPPTLSPQDCLVDWHDFLKKLNRSLKQTFPGVLLIAENLSCSNQTSAFDQGGFGFDLVWNQAWSSDLFDYVALDPIWRKYHHEKMTFSLINAFEKKYLLPISHSDVSQGKKSFLDKMDGDYWQKFAGARAFLGYMMTHPGKKMLFMGTEIGQFREWNPRSEIEWFLLEYESHAKLQRYVSELNHFYLSQAPLWQKDHSWDGFRWIDADNRNQSILSFRRIASDGKELIVLINFTPVVYEDFRLGVPIYGIYEEVFNSDREEYGGSGVTNTGSLKCESIAWNFLPQSVRLRIPPLGMTVLRCKRKAAKTSKKS